MSQQNKFFIVVLITTILFTNCASRQLFKADLWGIVYDGDGQPLSEVNVYNEKGKLLALSDIEGRFVLPRLDFDNYSFEIKKEGFETINTKVNFSRKTEIFYIRISNFSQLSAQLEKAMSNELWLESLDILARMKKFNSSSHLELEYYHAIILYRQQEFAQSIAILEKLIAKDSLEPYSYLLLADIYQYELNDTQKAQEALESVLNTAIGITGQLDSMVQERLQILSKKQGI